MSIDPGQERKALRTSLDFDRRAERTEYEPNAVGNAAMLGLATAVRAWIVGLEDEAKPLVAKYRDWLADSIARDEDFGDPPSYFAALRQDALALAHWLLENDSDAELYGAALPLHERAWEDLQRQHGVQPDELLERYAADYLRDCHEAGESARGLAAYEWLAGRPAPAGDAENELHLAYLACAGELDVATGDRVLRRRLDGWLERGNTLRAAAWLKLVYWNSGTTTTASETLRKALELTGEA